ncbi:Proteasome activator complex subunit 4 [Coelomomyces lativittatus]|nr:Proteasome activator complex subunit 4 [Coelomomyces lativittatus]
MKYPLNLDDRVYFIRLYYELIILPSMPPILLDVWVNILSRLLKKKKLLQPVEQSLVFDWRPIYNLVHRTIYRKQTASQIPYSHNKSTFSLAKALDHLTFYFSIESADEIMEILSKKFSLHRLEPTLLTACLWNLFMPPRHTTRKHITLIFELWSQFMNINTLDALLLDWVSRVALEQPEFPWQPQELQHLFTVGLQILDLPVGSSAVTTTISSSNSSSSSNVPSYSTSPISITTFLHVESSRMELISMINSFISKKKMFDPLRAFARIAIYTIHSLQSFQFLKTALRSMHNFFHPSNSGKWTSGLTSFLSYLACAFVRLKHELSENDFTVSFDQQALLNNITQLQPEFIDLLYPLVSLCLFSKNKYSLQSAVVALKKLVLLNPATIMPSLLELVYPALATDTESHRTLACISALGPLVFSFHEPEVALNPETDLPHLNALMFLVLPGLDVNDAKKTHSTLQFIHAVIVSHSFLQVPDAMDWIVQFLKQVFYFLEQFDESTDHHQASNMPRDDLDPLFYTVLNNLFAQLPLDTMYPVALSKTLDWCRTHFLPMSVMPISRLVHTLVKYQPHLALPKFLDWLIPKLQLELDHEAGTVATLRATKQPSLNSLLWYLRITMAVTECEVSALLLTRSKWEHILKIVFQFKDRLAMHLSHLILSKLIQALTTYQYQAPSVAMLVEHDFPFQNLFLTPSTESIRWATELVHTHLQNVMVALTNLCDHHIGEIAEFHIQHAFLSEISILNQLIKATSYWRRHPGPETVYVDRCVQGDKEYEQLSGLLFKVCSTLMPCSETPVDILELLVETIENLVYQYGVDAEKVRGRLNGHHYMKDTLRSSVHSKKLPLSVHYSRIGLCHLQRFQTNALRRVLHDNSIYIPKLMELLLSSCQSEYTTLRKVSQHALNLCLQAFPSQKFTFLGKLLENFVTFTSSSLSSQSISVIPNLQGNGTTEVLPTKKTKETGPDGKPMVTSAQMKGILHTLLSKPFMLACARNPTFLSPFIQGLVQLTKMQTDWKAKSIQPLLQRIIMKFMMMYPVPNEPMSPTVTLQVLLKRYLDKSSLIQQSPENWVQAARSTYHQNQIHLQQSIAYLTELLSHPATLHWRTTTLGLTFSHIFMRSLHVPLALAVIPYCIDAHPTVRKISESCTREWLAVVKEKLSPSNKILLSNESEGYMDAFHNDGFQTISQDYGYPFQISSLGSSVKVTDDMESRPGSVPVIHTLSDKLEKQKILMQPIFQFFLDPKFLERVFHYHSLETINSQSHKEVFYVPTALTAKQLADLIGYPIIPLILPLILPFLTSDEPSKVRCGVEWTMGLLRGTKHWLNPAIAWDGIGATLLGNMQKAGPELLSIWESGFRFLIHRRDPRRYTKFIQTLWEVPEFSSHVFSESRGLVYLKVLVHAFGTRISISFLTDILNKLERLLPSPLKLVRTALAQLIFEIFSVLSSVPSGNLIVEQYVNKWKDINTLSSRKTLVFLFYLAGRHFKKNIFQSMASPWYPLAEALLLDVDPDTSELAVICCLVVAQANIQFPLSLPSTDFVTVKLKRLQFLQIYIFHHLFYVFHQPPIDRVISLLTDPSLEVRNLAGITLTGFFQCFPDTQVQVESHVNTWLKSKDPTLRHAGVLILISRISMHPYSMPPHVPKLLEQLAGYIEDQYLYIQTAVRKSFSEFKRTHMDTWHLDLLSMTGEQVALMSDVLASSSYFV